MGVKHMTYLDLPEEQRREAANEARARLRGHLSNPTLTPDQSTAILNQIAEIDRWEIGAIPVEARAPVSHVIELNETAEFDENAN